MCKLHTSQPTHPTHVSSGVTTCVKRPAGRAACGKAAERNPHERERDAEMQLDRFLRFGYCFNVIYVSSNVF